MRKMLILTSILIGLTSIATSATYVNEALTPAQNGTLPSTLIASYDPGVDVIVVPLSTMDPAIPADHPGGDGYVLRVGDIGSGGGFWNWAYQAAGTMVTDTRISGWVYCDWTTWDSPPIERDYLLMLRCQTAEPNSGTYYRQGYMFAITANSSWSGISPNPTSFRPFIMKRVDATSTVIGSEGTADITTGWHFVAFEASGTTLRGYVDGVKVCEGTDTQYNSGYAAWGYYEENGAAISYPYAAAWDNLQYGDLVAEVQDWTLY